MKKEFKCPLCDSPISESKFNEVVRMEETKKKFQEEQKKQLELLKLQRAKMTKDVEELKKKAEKDKQIAIQKAKQEAKKEFKGELSKAKKQGLQEGMAKQMKRTEATNKLLQKSLIDIGLKDKQIKELQEQIKKGTTPQIEGLELEKKLVEELKRIFPTDEIIHYGQQGDILHKIIHNQAVVGSILYECKKTKKYDKKFIKQIKEDMATRNATYGVLLTYAFDKGNAGFKTEEGIIVIHPYGTIHLAEFLRKKLIEIYSLKLTKSELAEHAKKLWEYVKSDKFKNNIQDSIYRTKQLMELLEKERSVHERMWEMRNEHYNRIRENTSSVEKDSSIILNETEIEDAPPELENDLIFFPTNRKKKKILMEEGH
jgi:hypothetical protein